MPIHYRCPHREAKIRILEDHKYAQEHTFMSRENSSHIDSIVEIFITPLKTMRERE